MKRDVTCSVCGSNDDDDWKNCTAHPSENCPGMFMYNAVNGIHRVGEVRAVETSFNVGYYEEWDGKEWKRLPPS